MSEIQPFSGFPPAGLHFLKDLAANNERDWFQAHKQTYLDQVQAPALAFVVALGERLKALSDGIVYDTRANGSGSLMRIYRDVRFSKDKSPYKTNVGIVFWEGSGKKLENPGFYFHMEPDGGIMYQGIYMFSKPMLEAYRDAVVDDKLGAELDVALESLQKAGDYGFGGEQYKRVPRGYDADHPRADLLRYKGMGGQSPPITPETLASPDLVDVCFEHCRAMYPLHQWLVKVHQRVVT